MAKSVSDQIKQIVSVAAGVGTENIKLEHPETEDFGDYSTNVALVMKGGNRLAEEVASKIERRGVVREVKVAGPGFINLYLDEGVWWDSLKTIEDETDMYGRGTEMSGKKIMVEYAHPNTHKEMHIGHMRTLITGEAISRLMEANGASVFRANYQGDIGPHVAKAIWGTEKLLNQRGLSWEKAEELSLYERAHLLGEGYVLGSGKYEDNKVEIDSINRDLYKKNSDKSEIYSKTREWSLDYYKSFYLRFGTKFDRLFFESEVAERGLDLVKSNVGRVFEQSEGAIIFDGEKYGLHKRVFVTGDGNPTYEGKEMGLAYAQKDTFDFDRCIHVVANEQTGYFSVVIKALEILDDDFAGKEYHLPMGMVNLVGRKMSSRSGVVLTVDSLIDEVKALSRDLIKINDINEHDEAIISEAVALAAIKYSVLKTNPELNVAFDLKQSVNMEGSSGPYLQYTLARCRSVISRAGRNGERKVSASDARCKLEKEEVRVLRWLSRYPEVIHEAGIRLGPHLVATYLHELSTKFNSFYNQHSILSADNLEVKRFRLRLTEGVAQVLKNGFQVLGIEALDRM